MSAWRPLLALAWRESRTARRRLLLYMSSISLGVAALVAIDSFAGNVTRSVREQSRALLGGDLSISSRRPFAPAVDSLLDSLRGERIGVARVTTFASMALVPRTGGTRLVQVRAVTPEYPFYGAITTRPAAAFAGLHAGPHVLVDPALLVSLDARLGDTLTLGYGRFAITGTLDNVPGDAGVEAAIGPRVYIPARYLAETQLLVFGSRARYQALLRLPAQVDPATFLAARKERLEAAEVRTETVEEAESELTESVGQLADFLAVVGLVALLLGGIGVASGVHAYVAKKIDTVAVLRCLGATSGQVLTIYVLQAAVMGVVGAVAGAALGVGVQFALPRVLADFLPVDVRVTVEQRAVVAGLLVGLWVALVFALRPLLALRRVTPLQALRRNLDADALRGRWRDPLRLAVELAMAVSVAAFAIVRAATWREGVGVSLAIGAALLLLGGSATLLVALARRLPRARWPFVVRQGIANLHRPGNQTHAVVLALGFGAFLVGTIYQVQHSLLQRMSFSEGTRANVVFFDVQGDQGDGVREIVEAAGHRVTEMVPIIPMRIAEINGEPTSELLKRKEVSGWAVRREYRSTYRDTLVSSERLVLGKWFGADAPAGRAADGIAEVSFEREVVRELGIGVGDTVTWDVQGLRVPTRVTSLREVEWARFEPNFFAVFPSAALADAPRQYVLLADVPDARAVARLQRDIVARYPNVSSLDLSLIRRTISDIVARVSTAIRFLAVLCVALAVPVLFSAVAATRRDRLREGVLLKTLGATRAQIGRILLAEYTALGLLGSLVGLLLSFGSAWALTHFVFEAPFVPAALPALALLAGAALLAVAIGGLTGRDVFSETPMAALRES